MRKVFLAALLMACAPAVESSVQEVTTSIIYDDNDCADEASWTEVTSTNHVFVGKAVIDNGLGRVTHFTSATQKGFHHSWVYDGTALELATSASHGDYTYWSQSVSTDPYSVTVASLDPAVVEYKFAITGVYDQIDLTKRISMRDGSPGMFVEFHSLPVNPVFEREWGTGSGSLLTFSRWAVIDHPIHNRHSQLATQTDASGATWTASLRTESLATGMLSVVVFKRPMYERSMVFAPGQLGIHVVNRFDEQPGDGVQAYVEGIPYSDELVLEGWTGNLTTMTDALASGGTYQVVWADVTASRNVDTAAGTYDVWVRHRSTRAPPIEFTWPSGSTRIALTTTPHDFLIERVAQISLLGGTSALSIKTFGDLTQLDAVYLLPTGLIESVVTRVSPVF